MKLLGGFVFQVYLSVSRDGFLRFGDTIMLVNSGGAKQDPREPCSLSIIADLSNMRLDPQTSSDPYLQGPCLVGGASSLKPCVRNALVVTRLTFSHTHIYTVTLMHIFTQIQE